MFLCAKDLRVFCCFVRLHATDSRKVTDKYFSFYVYTKVNVCDVWLLSAVEIGDSRTVVHVQSSVCF